MKKQNTKEILLDITFEEVYKNGYTATSVDKILKRANIPKGSMYHHFKSKKELVLNMVEHRLFPKIDTFFKFEISETKSVLQSLRGIFSAISKNRMLITYGCPMYRLMVEMSPVDKDFDKLLSDKYIQILDKLTNMLEYGVKSGEFNSQLNCKEFAKFIITSSWGVLSLSPSLSSSAQFLKHSKYILENLELYKN